MQPFRLWDSRFTPLFSVRGPSNFVLPQQRRWRGVASSRRYRMHMTQGTMMSCMLNWCFFRCCKCFFYLLGAVGWACTKTNMSICLCGCGVGVIKSSERFSPIFRKVCGAAQRIQRSTAFLCQFSSEDGGNWSAKPRTEDMASHCLLRHPLSLSECNFLDSYILFWTASGFHPSTRWALICAAIQPQ